MKHNNLMDLQALYVKSVFTDAELAEASKRLEFLENELRDLGPTFGIAVNEIIKLRNVVNSMIWARKTL